MCPAHLESIVAEIQPAEIDEVQESVDLEAFQTTVTHVEMLERHVRREITSAYRRRPEDVSVEIQLERVARNRVRDRGESASRTVNDPAVCVAETGLRAGWSQPEHTPEVDKRQEHAQKDGSGRRRSHCSRK